MNGPVHAQTARSGRCRRDGETWPCEVVRLRAERDTALRFALTPTWDARADFPDPRDSWVVRNQVRAAFEANPSLDELLAGAR